MTPTGKSFSLYEKNSAIFYYNGADARERTIGVFALWHDFTSICSGDHAGFDSLILNSKYLSSIEF
jgi:hypothetical protein